MPAVYIRRSLISNEGCSLISWGRRKKRLRGRARKERRREINLSGPLDDLMVAAPAARFAQLGSV